MSEGKNIEELQKVYNDLSQNEVTHEIVALKTKLESMRQEWQSKREAVEHKVQCLSTDVVHFKDYQQTVEKLEPLLQRLNAAVASTVDTDGNLMQCDNLDDLMDMIATNKVGRSEIFSKLYAYHHFIDLPSAQQIYHFNVAINLVFYPFVSNLVKYVNQPFVGSRRASFFDSRESVAIRISPVILLFGYIILYAIVFLPFRFS